MGKKTTSGLFMSMLVCLVAVSATAAESERPAMGVTSDFVSRYIWRGIALSEGAVWQPSAYFDVHGLGVSLWGNFVLNDEANQGEFNELDYTFYYRGEWRSLTIEPALVVYSYPNSDAANTVESSLRLAYSIGPVELFEDVAIDMAEYAGAVFFDIGAQLEHDFLPTVTAGVAALFGVGNSRFNRAYIADVGSAANLIQGTASVTWTAWRALALSPYLTLSALIDAELRSAVDDPTLIYGGVTIGYDF